MKEWPCAGVLFCRLCGKKTLFGRDEPLGWIHPPLCCGLHMKTCVRGQYRQRLVKLIKSTIKDPEFGVEVGVNLGETSAFLLSKFNKLSLVSVDIWKRKEKEKEARKLLSRWSHRSSIAKMTSVEAAKFLYHAQLDFVYIDADHSYEAVRDDLHAWYPLVRPGGLFCGHDYKEGGKYIGVVKAVDEFFGKKPDHDDTAIWWVIK